jgi:hypothetical protein
LAVATTGKAGGEFVPPDKETNQMAETTDAETTETQPEMCCDGQKTAEEHRHESEDGKCCIDE